MELGYINPIDEGLFILILLLISIFIIGFDDLNNMSFLFNISYIEVFVCFMILLNVLFILISFI